MSDRLTLKPAYDVLVVGARCAGAATAMLLARHGLSVLVVDRSAYGSDTLSTHALMRPAAVQLARWGLLPQLRAQGTPAVTRTVFRYGAQEVDVPIRPRGPLDALYAPRRTLLDRTLVDAARQAGAEVRHGLSLVRLLQDRDGRVAGAVLAPRQGQAIEVRADLVIGADGRNSKVAELVGAPTYRRAEHTTATIYGYYQGLPAQLEHAYHWYYAPGLGVGAIPTDGGMTCVFAGTSPERFRREVQGDLEGGMQRLLKACDGELYAHVRRARPVGRLRGFAGQHGFLRRSHGPGFALVGDAGYFKDPLSAHGISDALRDAELLANAVASGTQAALARYTELRDELSLRFFELTDRLAACTWDLTEVASLHRGLSEEMKQESRMMEGWKALPDLQAAS